MMELYLLPFYVANVLLLFSFPLVPLAIHYAGQAAVSLETQCLILLTFLLRYTDLYSNWQRHNTFLVLFKTAYIALATFNVVVLAAAKWYAGRRCTWPTLFIPIVSVSTILALPLRYKSTSWGGEVLEFSWAMSEYLGGLSILPQLLHTWTYRFLHGGEEQPIRAHTTMFLYLSVLLTHQSLYMLNWLLKYIVRRSVDPISITSGFFRFGSIVVFLRQYAKYDPEGQVLLV